MWKEAFMPKISSIHRAILVERRLVTYTHTDRQTDRHWAIAYTVLLAQRRAVINAANWSSFGERQVHGSSGDGNKLKCKMDNIKLDI